MNYAAPQQATVCQCRYKGLAPMFCGYGHLLECHYPLNCRQAACNHLPRYEEELTPREMAKLEEQAIDRLRCMANAECAKCDGAGITEVRYDVPMNGATLAVAANSVCACVLEPGHPPARPQP